jgi:hypothetical protein
VQRNLDDDQSGSRGRAGDILVGGGPFRFPFAVECKDRKEINSTHLWKGSAALARAWRQTRSQADAVELEPLLVLKPKEHGHPVLAVMPTGCRRVLRVAGPVMASKIEGDAVAAVLWRHLLEVPPVGLVEVGLYLYGQMTSAEVAEQTAQDIQRWQWLAKGGDGGGADDGDDVPTDEGLSGSWLEVQWREVVKGGDEVCEACGGDDDGTE